MTRTIAIASLVIVSITAPAQVPSPPPDVASAVTRIDKYPTGQVTFPNGVRGVPDVAYATSVGYRPLKLDLYLPPASMPQPANRFPLVVQIHGGDWMSGDKRLNGAFVDFPAVLASLSARGYVVAAINYRLSGEAHFPAQMQDVDSALRWLRLSATQYGIDPRRTVTWGESAGAQLATLAAVNCHADAGGACVQGAVAWFGVFDMSTLAEQAKAVKALSREDENAPEWQLLGCEAKECGKEQLAAASPAMFVNQTDPPMLLIAGSDDMTVPVKQTLEMAGKLQTAGVKHDVLLLQGLDHNFIGKTPEATRDANLKALDATFKFIDQTIGPAK
jgi:acetyl esterase/lipase